MSKTKIPKPKKFQQNKAVKQHYHPRFLARAVVHKTMEREEMYGVNQVQPGSGKSIFSRNWRDYAGDIAR